MLGDESRYELVGFGVHSGHCQGLGVACVQCPWGDSDQKPMSVGRVLPHERVARIAETGVLLLLTESTDFSVGNVRNSGNLLPLGQARRDIIVLLHLVASWVRNVPEINFFRDACHVSMIVHQAPSRGSEHFPGVGFIACLGQTDRRDSPVENNGPLEDNQSEVVARFID